MTQEEFSRAFSRSPLKRAKLRGLKRNAAVVLGDVGIAGDMDVLTRALDDDEPLVREHAAWALGRVRDREGGLILSAMPARAAPTPAPPSRAPAAAGG